MELSEYLMRSDLHPALFARMVGVKSRTTVHRYISGERLPAPDIARRIYHATEGQVTHHDMMQTYRRRLCLVKSREQDNQQSQIEYPWSRLEEYAERWTQKALQEMLKEPLEGNVLSPPAAKAVAILGERVVMNKRQTSFKLDWRPAGLREIVRAANVALKNEGKDLIAYPGVQEMGDKQ